MPSARARADDPRRVARKLGFHRARQSGSHERCRHADGRATTIPVHGGQEIGPPLFHRLLQLGISEEIFAKLRKRPETTVGCRRIPERRLFRRLSQMARVTLVSEQSGLAERLRLTRHP